MSYIKAKMHQIQFRQGRSSQRSPRTPSWIGLTSCSRKFYAAYCFCADKYTHFWFVVQIRFGKHYGGLSRTVRRETARIE